MQVRLISLPRAGHHYLARSITTVFADSGLYCEAYSCSDSSRNFRDCSYRGPRPVLVCSTGSTVLKTHDFRLDYCPGDDEACIVLDRRNVGASLASLYSLERRKSAAHNVLDFVWFALARLPYVAGFRNKYQALCANQPEIFRLYFYEDLAEKFPKPLTEICELIKRGSLDCVEQSRISFVEPFRPSPSKLPRVVSNFLELTCLLLQALPQPVLKSIVGKIIQVRKSKRKRRA